MCENVCRSLGGTQRRKRRRQSIRQRQRQQQHMMTLLFYLIVLPLCVLSNVSQHLPPDRQYFWHQLLPSIFQHHNASTTKLNVLSIGQSTIEDERTIKRLLSNRSNLLTMDINRSVRRIFGNSSYHFHFDIVIVNSVFDVYGAELQQDEEESVRQLFAGISSASKSGATVIVQRRMSPLCCSMSIYERSRLSPTKVRDLPWRRSFILPIGGHVFDTLRNYKRRPRRQDDTKKQDSAPPHELSSLFLTEVDGIPQRVEIVVPMLTNVHEREQERRQAARFFCDALSPPCEQIINQMLTANIQIYSDLVEKRTHCHTHSILFVAHPDDEALFFGAELVTHPTCWVVVALTNGNNQWRKAEFEESMKRSGATGLIWSYKDCSTCLPFISAELSPILLEDQVRFLLDLRSDWSRIVTHGIAGEYGHPQHRALHNIIVNVCEDVGCLSKLWCVHPVAWHLDWVSRSQQNHSQLERFSLLEAYGSQQHAIRKFINLETVVVPYHEHVQNISSLAVGCQHSLDDRNAAAFFRWFCNSWVGKN